MPRNVYYAILNGKVSEPFTQVQIIRLTNDGMILAETPVRRGLDGEWYPARCIKGLAPFISAAPTSVVKLEPAPQPKYKTKKRWWIAGIFIFLVALGAIRGEKSPQSRQSHNERLREQGIRVQSPTSRTQDPFYKSSDISDFDKKMIDSGARMGGMDTDNLPAGVSKDEFYRVSKWLSEQDN